MPLLTPTQDNSEETEEGHDVAPKARAVSQPEARRFLVFDWVALVIILAVALGGAGIYVMHEDNKIPVAFQPSFPSQNQVPPVAPVMPRVSSPIVPPVAPTVPPQASTPAPRATTAQPRREVVYVLKPSVNVRSEPSATSQVLSISKTAGRRLSVFQRQGEWVQVGEEGPIGWVHQSLIGPTPP